LFTAQRVRKYGLLLIMKRIGARFDDIAVMHNPIRNSRFYLVISEDLRPVTEGHIANDA